MSVDLDKPIVFFAVLHLSIANLRVLGSKIWSHVIAIFLTSSDPEKIGNRYRQRFSYNRQFLFQRRASMVYSFKPVSIQAGDNFATFLYSILRFVPLLL